MTERKSLLSAVASQQQVIVSLREDNARLTEAIQTIAHYAGLTQIVADVLNPASPVPDPASEGAVESTEQALAPLTTDDPEAMGATPGANQGLAAEMTTTPMTPGTAIDTQPFNKLIDVTAPVSGTETHVPNEQTKIDTDVRVGNPMNPEQAFPLQGEFARSGDSYRSASRTMSSIKLARLRVQAGLEEGDDIEVAGRIEANASLSDYAIDHEIEILSGLKAAASKTAAKAQSRNLVPRTAGGQRKAPSLASDQSLGFSVTAVTAADTQDADLFLGDFGD